MAMSLVEYQKQFPNDVIAQQLTVAVQSAVKATLETEIEAAQARVADAIRGAVGSISAKVLQNFSFERMGNDLVIRVAFAFAEPSKKQL